MNLKVNFLNKHNYFIYSLKFLIFYRINEDIKKLAFLQYV